MNSGPHRLRGYFSGATSVGVKQRGLVLILELKVYDLHSVHQMGSHKMQIYVFGVKAVFMQ